MSLIERGRDMCLSDPQIPSCKLCGELTDEIERLTAALQNIYNNASHEGEDCALVRAKQALAATEQEGET